MNYKESLGILEKIKAAKRVFITCHAHPDEDSVGSALALQEALSQLKIKSLVVCVDDISDKLMYLHQASKITKTDLESFIFNPSDLVLILDISTWSLIFGHKPASIPKFAHVQIDHHKEGDINAPIKIIDPDRSATAELLYAIFEDWGINVTSSIATSLLTGIIGDTGSFKFDNATSRTMRIAADLIDKGAEKDTIYLWRDKTVQFSSYKQLGMLLNHLTLEKTHKFVWSAVPYEEFVEVGDTDKNSLTDIIFQSVVDTNFGFRAIEKEKNIIDVAFRSRDTENIDVSIIAKRLGGGGHSAAAGARVEGSFNEVLERVLNEAKQFSIENKPII